MNNTSLATTFSAPRQRSQAGFTLIELIVVIVIAGVLAAAAYSRIGTDSFDEGAYRDQVSAALSFARKAAVAQRRKVRVSVDGNTLRLRIAKRTPEDPIADPFSGVEGRDLEMPGSGSAQVAPRGRATLSGPAMLVFGADGQASATSYVYTIGSNARPLTVDSLTGYVR